jgi:hypothetical protein
MWYTKRDRKGNVIVTVGASRLVQGQDRWFFGTDRDYGFRVVSAHAFGLYWFLSY